MLVCDVTPEGTLVQHHHEAVLTRLGEGLGASGALLPAAVDRTLAVVARYAERVRADGAETIAIATSAVRRADDGDAFRARFHALAGVELRLLSGEEEARSSFRGATYGVEPEHRVAVLDIGGGSTECAVGRAAVEVAASVEIGAVRLTERFPALAGRHGRDAAFAAAAEARTYVQSLLAPAFATMRPGRVIAVAGTPQTIAAIAYAGEVRSVVGRALLANDAADVLLQMLERDDDARRVMPGMTPERADILAAGTIIYLEALALLMVSEATVTVNDLLLGQLIGT